MYKLKHQNPAKQTMLQLWLPLLVIFAFGYFSFIRFLELLFSYVIKFYHVIFNPYAACVGIFFAHFKPLATAGESRVKLCGVCLVTAYRAVAVTST